MLENLISVDKNLGKKIIAIHSGGQEAIAKLSVIDQEMMREAALVCAIAENKTPEEIIASTKGSQMSYPEQLFDFTKRVKDLAPTIKPLFPTKESAKIAGKHTKEIVGYATEILALLEVIFKLNALIRVISSIRNYSSWTAVATLGANKIASPLDVNSYFEAEVAGKEYNFKSGSKSTLARAIKNLWNNWPKSILVH